MPETYMRNVYVLACRNKDVQLSACIYMYILSGTFNIWVDTAHIEMFFLCVPTIFAVYYNVSKTWALNMYFAVLPTDKVDLILYIT